MSKKKKLIGQCCNFSIEKIFKAKWLKKKVSVDLTENKINKVGGGNEVTDHCWASCFIINILIYLLLLYKSSFTQDQYMNFCTLVSEWKVKEMAQLLVSESWNQTANNKLRLNDISKRIAATEWSAKCAFFF